VTTPTLHTNTAFAYANMVDCNSDSELMLSLLADELLKQPPAQASGSDAERRILGADNVFAAVRGLMQRARGGYACVMLVAGHGIVAFRDPCEYSHYCSAAAAVAVEQQL
jgi:glutamine phosphoribosylpyrophosphate amidotransferase